MGHNGKSRNQAFDKRKYPLRKVIERRVSVIFNNETLSYEEGETYPLIFANRLECGHFIRPAKDFYGEIHSDKQRCKECAKQVISKAIS